MFNKKLGIGVLGTIMTASLLTGCNYNPAEDNPMPVYGEAVDDGYIPAEDNVVAVYGVPEEEYEVEEIEELEETTEIEYVDGELDEDREIIESNETNTDMQGYEYKPGKDTEIDVYGPALKN